MQLPGYQCQGSWMKWNGRNFAQGIVNRGEDVFIQVKISQALQ